MKDESVPSPQSRLRRSLNRFYHISVYMNPGHEMKNSFLFLVAYLQLAIAQIDVPALRVDSHLAIANGVSLPHNPSARQSSSSTELCSSGLRHCPGFESIFDDAFCCASTEGCCETGCVPFSGECCDSGRVCGANKACCGDGCMPA